MKSIILKIATAFVLLVSSSDAIPVIDAPQLYENIQTVARWKEQITQWSTEIDQWKDQYDAITGFKLDGNILDKFMQINTLLGEQGLDMTDLDLDNPKSQIGVLAQQLFGEYTTIFNDCVYTFMSDDDKRICKDTIVREVQEMAAVKEIATSVDKTLKKLNDLNTQLAEAKDIKTSQDVTAAMNSTFASLELMSSKLEMMSMKNEAKEKIDARQRKQIYMKKFEHADEFMEAFNI